MHTSAFQDAIAAIIQKDSRFDPDAYFFLKEALDFTVKKVKEENDDTPRHVSGPELLTGFRDYAIQEFGPFAVTILREWGLRTSRNIGEMVFALIEEQVFSKQDSDTLDDFADIYQFNDAFVTPFLPTKGGIRPSC